MTFYIIGRAEQTVQQDSDNIHIFWEHGFWSSTQVYGYATIATTKRNQIPKT